MVFLAQNLFAGKQIVSIDQVLLAFFLLQHQLMTVYADVPGLHTNLQSHLHNIFSSNLKAP